jgi:hypothetical protein
MYPIHISKFMKSKTGSRKFPDTEHVDFRQFRPTAAFSESRPTMQGTIHHVREVCIPSEIANRIVQELAVIVTALLASRTRTDECLQHNTMEVRIPPSPFATDSHREVSTSSFRERLEESPLIGHNHIEIVNPSDVSPAGPDRTVAPDEIAGKPNNGLENNERPSPVPAGIV